MAHFRIAEQLLKHLPDVDARAFILGNVAPDSGRPNADWTVFEPPKTVTHFLNAGEDEGRIRDVQFWREYVRPADRHTRSFMLGYFTHLVADNLWMHLIGEPAKKVFAAEFSVDRAAAWDRVKDDWYGLDFKYLRDNPDNVFTRHVAGTLNPPSPLPFLSSEGLAESLDSKRTFYASGNDMVLDRPYPYLSEASMNRVVEDSTEIIAALLAQLGMGDVPENENISLHILDLPAPYALP
ncbi:zinc dependent phospholipase C family protein [Deinococcus arenicola]|uniref:Zinc dependent phospholipase C family protein n=1 Tax=Deinococcus arenicola TaxID=2994950 RepID=A0ABU4DNI1_9DEIO|nr:zinc dependent phospholipase C family protein [Deinococcus sp. ZS9-10]MDV6373992.1 zinc dependent phospholipase C family protein [Deinococcus sp. ZS9-10]